MCLRALEERSGNTLEGEAKKPSHTNPRAAHTIPLFRIPVSPMNQPPVKAIAMSERAGADGGEEEKHEPPLARAASAALGDAHPLSLEDTPAYKVLRHHGLLVNKYRIDTDVGSAPALDCRAQNSTRSKNLLYDVCCCPLKCLFRTFEVPAGHVRLADDGRGGFEFYGQGVHLICDPFYTVRDARPYARGVIQHGDRTIVIVEQGHIGYALDKGQPVLLPPGLHQWRSPTLAFLQASARARARFAPLLRSRARPPAARACHLSRPDRAIARARALARAPARSRTTSTTTSCAWARSRS